MLDRSKLNSIETKISEALMNDKISHEDFLTIINEERIYRELKESIRMMKGSRRNTESINPGVLKTSNGKTMILSKCAICDSKKSKLIKEQQEKGLLSNLRPFRKYLRQTLVFM